MWFRCSIPDFDGASLILRRQEEDVRWDAFFTAAPARRRVFEPNSKRRKRAAVPMCQCRPRLTRSWRIT
jgi:hypothetical protein